jgi:hypothetical protein
LRPRPLRITQGSLKRSPTGRPCLACASKADAAVLIQPAQPRVCGGRGSKRAAPSVLLLRPQRHSAAAAATARAAQAATPQTAITREPQAHSPPVGSPWRTERGRNEVFSFSLSHIRRCASLS